MNLNEPEKIKLSWETRVMILMSIKSLQEHPWIWHKIYELTVMFLSNYSQKYSQSLTGESQDHILKLVLNIYSEVNDLI